MPRLKIPAGTTRSLGHGGVGGGHGSVADGGDSVDGVDGVESAEGVDSFHQPRLWVWRKEEVVMTVVCVDGVNVRVCTLACVQGWIGDGRGMKGMVVAVGGVSM